MLSFDLVDAYLARTGRQIQQVIGGRHLHGNGLWFDPSYGRGAWVIVYGEGGSPEADAAVSYTGVYSLGRAGETTSTYTAYFTEHDLLRAFIANVSDEAQFLVFCDWVKDYSGVPDLPVRKGLKGWELIGFHDENEMLQRNASYVSTFFWGFADCLSTGVNLFEPGSEYFAAGEFGPHKPRAPQPEFVGNDDPASFDTVLASQWWTFDSLHRFQRRRNLRLLRVGNPALGARWCSREAGESWEFHYESTVFCATTEAEIVRAAWCDQLFHMDAPDRDESVNFLVERAAVRSDADSIRNEILDRLGDGELTALELLQ